MIIAVLKEGSAGPLPLSGAAPAIWVGWKGRRRMKGSRRNKANVIIPQIISMPVRETSEIFFTLTFLTQGLAKKGRSHESTPLSSWKTRTAQTFYMHQPYNTHHPDLKRPTFVSISAVHSIWSPALMCCRYLSSAS